nr:hypothetical protein Iba_chr04aCG23690 [Ipomoea batatas]
METTMELSRCLSLLVPDMWALRGFLMHWIFFSMGPVHNWKLNRLPVEGSLLFCLWKPL